MRTPEISRRKGRKRMGSNHRKIYAIDGVVPVIDPSAFVHPDAVVIGDVVIGADCYVGPGASLRGDFGRIVVERGSNVQDNCTLHCQPGFDLVVGPDGHIGHGAIIHGARIGANVMVGMNAVIMDYATIGDSSVVAAMSFVATGVEIPPRHLAAGIPARVVRELSDEEIARKLEATQQYHQLARRSLATLQTCQPLTHFDVARRRVDAGFSMPLRDKADSMRRKKL